MNKSTQYGWLILMALLLVSVNSYAEEWQLESESSQLNFISIKKSHVAEINQFTDIQGSLDSKGELEVKINLASIDTAVIDRDNRMKKFLFEINDYAIATLCATIDTELLEAIAEGSSANLTVDAELDLHGVTESLTIDVIVTRLVGAKISVVSARPIILNADDFSLASGVEKLREIAKLPSISYAVPVTFYLIFNHVPK